MLQNKVEKIASAILFSTPGVNSSVKLNSLNAMYHDGIRSFNDKKIRFDDLFFF